MQTPTQISSNIIRWDGVMGTSCSHTVTHATRRINQCGSTVTRTSQHIFVLEGKEILDDTPHIISQNFHIFAHFQYKIWIEHCNPLALSQIFKPHSVHFYGHSPPSQRSKSYLNVGTSNPLCLQHPGYIQFLLRHLPILTYITFNLTTSQVSI